MSSSNQSMAAELDNALKRGDGVTTIKLLPVCAQILNRLLPQSGRLPLNLAISQKLSDVAVAMIESGANPNSSDSEGIALQLALERKQFDVAMRLLEHGANPAIYSDGKTILHSIALSSKHLSERLGRPFVGLAIQAGVNPGQQGDDYGTPLHCILQGEPDWLVHELCNALADPNAIHQRRGYRPLHVYTMIPRPKLVEAILQHGANPNGTTEERYGARATRTPLSMCCNTSSLYLSESLECARLLLLNNADPNFAPNGSPPLMEAVGDHGNHFIPLLLEHGASVNGVALDGRTPLMVAVTIGNVDAVRLLLKAGAKPKICDKSGKSSFDYLICIDDGKKREIVAKLLQPFATS